MVCVRVRVCVRVCVRAQILLSQRGIHIHQLINQRQFTIRQGSADAKSIHFPLNTGHS